MKMEILKQVSELASQADRVATMLEDYKKAIADKKPTMELFGMMIALEQEKVASDKACELFVNDKLKIAKPSVHWTHLVKSALELSVDSVEG